MYQRKLEIMQGGAQEDLCHKVFCYYHEELIRGLILGYVSWVALVTQPLQ